MRSVTTLAAAFVILLSLAPALVRADNNAAKVPANVTNKYCPVMGTANVVDPKVRMEYQGQYVYFCCQGCLDMFKKDPAQYIAKMPKEDLEAIKANEKCPTSGEKVDPAIRSELKGKLVYFCCAACKAGFDKENGLN